MWIIADARLPEIIKENLSNYGTLLEFSSNAIVYDAISGHPDIFCCCTDQQLIIAPNTPAEFIAMLKNSMIDFRLGDALLGNKYPETAHYNAVSTQHYLIHNLDYTDKEILAASQNKLAIHVNQAYTRCNLLFLNATHFITSGKGIEQTLVKHGLVGFYVHPEGIHLKGFSHGFFGGCCGIHKNRLFLNGSLSYLPEKKALSAFLERQEIEIIELYQGPLIDSGSLLLLHY